MQDRFGAPRLASDCQQNVLRGNCLGAELLGLLGREFDDLPGSWREHDLSEFLLRVAPTADGLEGLTRADDIDAKRSQHLSRNALVLAYEREQHMFGPDESK